MKFTAKQIAETLHGTVEGNENAEVNSISKIEEGKPGSISFLANPKYTHFIYDTDATIVIVNNSFEGTHPIKATLVRVENAENAFAMLLEMYNQVKLAKSGISKLSFISESADIGNDIYAGEFAVIADNAKIGNNVKIYPQVYVGENVVIGDNTTLFAGVKIYSDCVIGSDCIIHSGTVIGSDGFRFALQDGGKKIPQIGNVLIEDNVEIGSNCSIDRATFGSTILRKGVKLDNLVHIAHNVEINEKSYLAAQNVVAGSTKIGKNCMFSGQVGIIDHLEIADNTLIAAQSGVSKSIKTPGTAQMGSPSMDVMKYRKNYIHFRNFEAIVNRIEELEKQQSKPESGG
ncbi:MAG TPA: UDP-3-O-(3-hydroxymyristoyl)glucosamine N-acyltransferase [Flavobacteriales bacterium]|nr:UDP-3-O-(3-hydroxymyristoyl)glucosamine N-acyltransferase [Flavobacteriales bacterium]